MNKKYLSDNKKVISNAIPNEECASFPKDKNKNSECICGKKFIDRYTFYQHVKSNTNASDTTHGDINGEDFDFKSASI
jgi:hypothetical protein